MTFFTKPTSFSTRSMAADGAFSILRKTQTQSPDFGHLILLVFEAVLEVVCVSLPGFIVARHGLFDADAQKLVANLNVMLFTPCLVFTKIASQLTADKMVELAVIPVIFVVNTFVSYLCAILVAKLFRFSKRPRNFVIAMGIFGNANSLPISLVISLSATLKGLHWDKIPNDNDNEVAARGILYLMIFQQLGQLLRWSWGYHVLLAPPDKVSEEDEHRNSLIEQGEAPYRDDPNVSAVHRLEFSHQDLIDTTTDDTVDGNESSGSEYDSGDRTPLTHQQYTSSVSSIKGKSRRGSISYLPSTLANGDVIIIPTQDSEGDMNSVAGQPSSTTPDESQDPKGWKGVLARFKRAVLRSIRRVWASVTNTSYSVFRSLPKPMQSILLASYRGFTRFMGGVWLFMNPPLWAMLASIFVACVPSLQKLFFTEGTFFKNSVTRAVAQSGGVAVPLILVVLGANLARNTLPNDPNRTIEDAKEEKKILIAALISRMLLPVFIMAPLLAFTAKYVPVSILDDPIFVIVCFLLTGAPSALQLAQICQINDVYMGVMSKLLFQAYVIWIMPSTLVLVMLALEVVKWAG